MELILTIIKVIITIVLVVIIIVLSIPISLLAAFLLLSIIGVALLIWKILDKE
jgi:hypothetical protein